MEGRCIFCRIVAGDVPHHILAGSRLALAFMNANPATFGHALVIPKRHSADI
jgi:histidine triad (HIT) family protein